ncbi:MAG: alpha/beta hydrolase [Synechococcales bacterium]|nr:alpha/beta hydrolase [Synechococcales bacterium]
MLQFQPPGFGQQVLPTSRGVMAYYTPDDASFWRSPQPQNSLPPLVFLHSLGGGSSAYEWSHVYPAFAADYRVIAPDLVGWGQSAHPARDYQPEDYLAIATEILEFMGGRATVVASSLMAGYAVRVAIARPELVKSLFLVSPAGYEDFGVSYRSGLGARLAGLPGLNQLIYAVGAANEWAIRNFMTQFLFANPARITDEMVQAYLASALQKNAEYAALSALRGDLFFDLARYLPDLTQPTAIVWGEESFFNSPDLGERLAKLNTRAVKSFQVVPQAGVLPHLEQPENVIGRLQDWITSDA